MGFSVDHEIYLACSIVLQPTMLLCVPFLNEDCLEYEMGLLNTSDSYLALI
jgi:hypothetical protein